MICGFFSENKQFTLKINQEQKENDRSDINTPNAFAMWSQGKFSPVSLLNRGKTLL